jgi:hypothetical protein
MERRWSISCPTKFKKSILNYETEIKAGKFLLIAHGTNEEVTQAKNIIDRAGTTEAVLHQG